MITVTSFLGTDMFADEPAMPQSITVNLLSINGRTRVGDTVTLNVIFKSTEPGNVSYNFKFSDLMFPLNRLGGQTEQTDTISLKPDTTYTRSHRLRIQSEGFTQLIVELNHLSPNGKHSFDYKKLVVEHRTDWDTVVNGTQRYRLPFNYRDEVLELTDEKEKDKANSTSGAWFSFDFSGRVLARESNDQLYGVPNVVVKLVFMQNNVNGGKFWVEKLQQQKTDIHGNYSFIGRVWLNNWMIPNGKMRIVVGRWNDAASIYSGSYFELNDGGAGFFLDEHIRNYSTADTLIDDDWDVEVNNRVNDHGGIILRYMYLSREFCGIYYKKLPQILIEVEDIDAAGRFWGPFTTKEIKLHPTLGAPFFSTAAHEYGHYMHFDISWSMARESAKEGWANFFSYATRNWANKNYDDNLEVRRSNCEDGPFQWEYLDSHGNLRTGRYNAMSYTGDVEINGLACFLWNCYDGYEPNEFESNEYGNGRGDNDDVDNLKSRVFSIMINHNPSISEWLPLMKSGLPLDLKKSIDDVLLFCYEDINSPMRPAQIKNLKAVWCRGTQTINLQWYQQHYPERPNRLHNWEAGYRVERLDETVTPPTWVNVLPDNGTLSPNARSASVAVPSGLFGSECISLRVTAFNRRGNSYTPQGVGACPVTCVRDNDQLSEIQSENKNK